MIKRAIGLLAILGVVVSACGADVSGGSDALQGAESTPTATSVVTTVASVVPTAPSATATPATTAAAPVGNLLVDLGLLSGVTLELYASDEVAGSVKGPQLGLLTDQSGRAGFNVDPGSYDVKLTHDGASVILDPYDCDANHCERADPRYGRWQIVDFEIAMLVIGWVEQMHDLDPYLGGTWIREDQDAVVVSVTGDLAMRSELLRLAGLDVDSSHIEVVVAKYTMVELQATEDAIYADVETSVNEFNVSTIRIDHSDNVVVVGTSDTDTAALVIHLGQTYPSDMVTVEGGVEPVVLSDV